MGRESNGKQFVMYLLNVGKGGSTWDVARYSLLNSMGKGEGGSSVGRVLV
jgi:hypothetical protein